MKLKVEKSVLVDALQKVQPVVDPKKALPVLQNLLLKGEKGKLSISGTDLSISVCVTCAAEVSRTGGTTVNARRFAAIVKELPASEVEIETDEQHQTTVRSGSAFFRIFGISDEEFPPFPKLDGGTVYLLDQRLLRDMLRSVIYAASLDISRPELSGVLLSFKGDKFSVVATDGRRLALYEHTMEIPRGGEADLILPRKTAEELLRTLGDKDQAKVYAMGNQAGFEFNDMVLVSQLIVEKKYPNFRQVIPPPLEQRAKLERELFLAALRRVALVSPEQGPSVKLTFGKNKLEIAASSAQVGEAKETLAIAYTGPALTVSFNPDFLMEPLKTLVCDEVFFEVKDDLSPGVLRCELPFLYVLMPIRPPA